MQEQKIPDEQMLGAFVDGQLDATNSALVLAAMDRDTRIRDQVYELRRAKDLIKLGFGDAVPPRPVVADRRIGWRREASALAASLALLVVGSGAWSFGYYCSEQQLAKVSSDVISPGQQQAEKVVLHLSDANPAHFAAALDYVEQFISNNEGQGGQIEVIANAGGLDLVRVGVSPFEDRVRKILAEHGNVQFLACANALHNLQEAGVDAEIIGDIDSHGTAVDLIVDRLQSGWRYVKAESLAEL